jgi:CxxC-x17-CxxC domain-containing protein
MDEDSDDRGERGGFGGRGGRGGHGGGGGGGRFGGRGFGPREMHKATCSDCGQECEVPFKPTDGRPVYCRDCYQKHKKF